MVQRAMCTASILFELLRELTLTFLRQILISISTSIFISTT